jgi:outer membrane biosynthesis protein TonB
MSQRFFIPVGLALSVLIMSAAPSSADEGMCGGLFSFICPSPPPPPVAEPQPEPPPVTKPKHKPKKPHKAAVKPEAAPAPAPAAK